MRRRIRIASVVIVLVVVILGGFLFLNPPLPAFPVAAKPALDIPALPVPTASPITLTAFEAAATNPKFLAKVPYKVEQAKYYDLLDKELKLTTAEKSLLSANGFVVTDRLAFSDFVHGYAWIYWKDMPVLVTTDSLLHAVHKTYSDLLARAEEQIIAPKLSAMLGQTEDRLKWWARAGKGGALWGDLDIYLMTARSLLDNTPPQNSTVAQFVGLAKSASSVQDVTLFGSSRTIDFTQFTPRGHYNGSEALQRYFRAMMWLSQIDFRFVDYDPHGAALLHPEQIAVAIMLRDVMEEAGTRKTWREIDSLFTLWFGRSDNTTLDDLDRLVHDTGLTAPDDALKVNTSKLLDLLTKNDYGQQRITGQILSVDSDNPNPLPRPVSFMLLGQRFSVESYAMSNLVYDRLIVEGNKVPRAFPHPMDVMYVLGNNRAATHLQDELTRYGYQGNLEALRKSTDEYKSDFWKGSTYNVTLNMLRQLNQDTTGANYPQSMQTAAWADKTLHTQLAAWAELRHDTLIYMKQSFTVQPLCSYPAGYVEPYPAFYSALGEYADAGHKVLASIDTSNISTEAQSTIATGLTYFERLKNDAVILEEMAKKELRLEPFTPVEESFLRDIVIRKDVSITPMGCTADIKETWSGWYSALFPWEDKEGALVADIHTNTAELLPPQGVLHVATGNVAVQVFVVNTDEGIAAYAGPSFTYYDFLEPGMPPKRLTDGDWQSRMYQNPRPEAPSWTHSFLVHSPTSPEQLFIPYR